MVLLIQCYTRLQVVCFDIIHHLPLLRKRLGVPGNMLLGPGRHHRGARVAESEWLRFPSSVQDDYAAASAKASVSLSMYLFRSSSLRSMMLGKLRR